MHDLLDVKSDQLFEGLSPGESGGHSGREKRSAATSAVAISFSDDTAHTSTVRCGAPRDMTAPTTYAEFVKTKRVCSRPTCGATAVASLTYDYSEATAVIGPLPSKREPHAYELCEQHANAFTAPRGWQVIRLESNFVAAAPSEDDLLALAHAVREVAKAPAPSRSQRPSVQREIKRPPRFRVVEGG